MTETYNMDFRCKNCHWTGNLEVPKGTSRFKFQEVTECPNCGVIQLG